MSSPPPLRDSLASGDKPLSLGQLRSRQIKASSDDAVRATDSDALISRLSALRLGYLPPDPFSEDLITGGPSYPTASDPGPLDPAPVSRRIGPQGMGSAPPTQFGYAPTSRSPPSRGVRRPPLINIGTYLRCQSIDKLIYSFLLGKGKGKQIISLGAGSDSRYWRIMSDPRLSPHLSSYLELDFAELTRKKVSSIRKSSRLESLLSGIHLEDDSLRSDKYALLPFDLRTFSDERVQAIFSHLDTERPTLLLFECVLAYIEPGDADTIISWLGKRFGTLAAVGYDMCIAGPLDEQASRFGRVMLQNLETRGLVLPGAKAHATIQSQSSRYQRLWNQVQHTHGKSLFQVWDELDRAEKERLSRLEGLDEVEELDMLLKHYCITWASRGLEF